MMSFHALHTQRKGDPALSLYHTFKNSSSQPTPVRCLFLRPNPTSIFSHSSFFWGTVCLHLLSLQPPSGNHLWTNKPRHHLFQLLHHLAPALPINWHPHYHQGDFNIPIEMCHSTSTKLLSHFSSFCLSQWSSTATHIEGHTRTLFSPASAPYLNSQTLPISDKLFPYLLTFSSLFSSAIPPFQKCIHRCWNFQSIEVNQDTLFYHCSSYLHFLTQPLFSPTPQWTRWINRQPWHTNVMKKLWGKKKHSTEDLYTYKKKTLLNFQL